MQVEFNAIGGKAPKWTRIAEEIVVTLDTQTGPMLKDYHDRVVSPWRGEKPVFVIEKADSGKLLIRRIRPTGGKGLDKWMYLTQGTGLYGPKHRAYPIYPKRAKVLRFRTGYSPRTLPGAGGQYKGPGQATGATVFAHKVDKPGVTHPGIKKRRLPQAIARWAKPFFVKQMKAAVKRGAKEV